MSLAFQDQRWFFHISTPLLCTDEKLDGLTLNDEEADKYISEEWAKRHRRLAYKTAPPDNTFVNYKRLFLLLIFS